MTHDEFEQRERDACDVIDALQQVSRGTQASPDFLTQVLARADAGPQPRLGWRAWWRQVSLAAMPLPLKVAVAVMLVLAIVGAAPQYAAWINASILGVSTRTLHTARLQERLWERNFACATQLDGNSSAYAAITGEQVNVVVWACPSGDVLVMLDAPAGEVQRSIWVPLDNLEAPANFWSLTVRQAFAAKKGSDKEKRRPHVTRVVCQTWLPNRHIKRRIQLANGQCRDEIINPHTGKVVKSGKASCDASC